MKRIELIALPEDRKKLIERLQRRGIVEITNIEEKRFKKLDTQSQISQFERSKSVANNAHILMMRYFPPKKGLLDGFQGRREIEKHDFGKKAAQRDELLKLCSNVIAADKKIGECDSDIVRTNVLIETLEPWTGLDCPTNFTGTKRTRFFVGSISGKHTAQEIEDCISEKGDFSSGICVDVISSFKEVTDFYVICHKDDTAAMQTALREINFTELTDKTALKPAEQLEEYKKKLEKLEKDKQDALSFIEESSKRIADVEFLSDYFTIRKEKYEALAQLALTRNTFILTGYIPEKYADKFIKEFEGKFTCAISVYDLAEGEDAPVLLSNDGFAAPVEGITEMYALPGKHDIDPTSVMSFFYYFFFGMMLSDAGYGLVMVIGCALALKFMHLEDKMRKTLKMFLYCGISTVFWGAMFGSWFGDIVQVVAREFFGKEIGSIALWFEPLNDPIKLLLYCFAFGIVHLFVGVGANFYNQWRQGNKWDAIFDSIPVYLTVLGICPMGASILTTVPPILSQIGGYVAIAGVVLLVLTQGRSSKTIVGRLGGGLYALYNTATGYLSDILSYSRLLALGLATGCIASVINLIGTMPENLTVKAIMLVVVFIIGHLLNLAINVLGAYVHTDRLQFVEMFSKFYSGGGKAFKPLTVNSKYYKFKEEQINE